jgi:putative transposase
VLDRTFDASAPNRKWIADFTYVWTAEGWLYVAAVIDLFSRRVVGWSMRAAMTAQLVTDALVMAIWRRGKPDALLHHSDRGSQYTSEHFQKLMADHGVVCSMSRSGNVWDNAAMESFFSSLKTERTGRKTYRCSEFFLGALLGPKGGNGGTNRGKQSDRRSIERSRRHRAQIGGYHGRSA